MVYKNGCSPEKEPETAGGRTGASAELKMEREFYGKR